MNFFWSSWEFSKTPSTQPRSFLSDPLQDTQPAQANEHNAKRGTRHLEIKLSWKPNGCPQIPRTGMSLRDKQLLMALLAPRSLWNVTSLNTFGGELLCLYTEFPPYYQCLQSCHCTGTADLLTLISLSVHISCHLVSKGNFFVGTAPKQSTTFPLCKGQAHPPGDPWAAWSMPTQIQIYLVVKHKSPLSTASPCFPFGTHLNIFITLMLLFHNSTLEVLKTSRIFLGFVLWLTALHG